MIYDRPQARAVPDRDAWACGAHEPALHDFVVKLLSSNSCL
jgi:hypothetical protein